MIHLILSLFLYLGVFFLSLFTLINAVLVKLFLIIATCDISSEIELNF